MLAAVVTKANERGIKIHSIDIREPNLEAVFLHLTGRALQRLENSLCFLPSDLCSLLLETPMLKTFLIGIKDLRLVFRDRAALTFMLLAPFLLTVGMGFVTGRFSGTSNSGLSDIPVIIVNLDDAELGDALVDVFHSDELADLMEPAASSDPEAARRSIDDNQAAAAVIIPEGFTRSIIPAEGAMFNQSAAEADPV